MHCNFSFLACFSQATRARFQVFSNRLSRDTNCGLFSAGKEPRSSLHFCISDLETYTRRLFPSCGSLASTPCSLLHFLDLAQITELILTARTAARKHIPQRRGPVCSGTLLRCGEANRTGQGRCGLSGRNLEEMRAWRRPGPLLLGGSGKMQDGPTWRAAGTARSVVSLGF